MSNIAKPKLRKKSKKSPCFNFSKFLFKNLTLAFFLSFLVFFVYQIIQQHLVKNKILGDMIQLNSAEIISLVNIERQKHNLPALKPNQNLSRAAQAKLSDMFVYEYWDHLSPSNKPPWLFVLDAGYDYAFAGENLAKDFTDNQSLVEAWMESDDHRANILSPDYEDIAVIFGSGQIDDQPTILIVQFFGKQYTDQDYLDAGVTPPRQNNYQLSSLSSSQKPTQLFFLNLFWSLNDLKLYLFFFLGFCLGLSLFYGLNHLCQNQKNIISLNKLKKRYWGRV